MNTIINKLIYTIIFALIMVNANSCKTERKVNISSQGYLASSEWGPEIGQLGLYFQFTPKNTFKTDSNFEGGAYYSGTYEYKNDKLKLLIANPGEWPELKGTVLTYRLKQDSSSILFIECLALEDGDSIKDVNLKKLWNQRKIVANDQHRSFQNIAVQTINNYAEITDETNFYQSPNENSKRFMFSIHDSGKDTLSEWRRIVPAEAYHPKPWHVQLVLKTIKRDDKNRFWYLIILPVRNGGYDLIKIEGSSERWNGPSLGWIKETDIRKIEAK